MEEWQTFFISTITELLTATASSVYEYASKDTYLIRKQFLLSADMYFRREWTTEWSQRARELAKTPRQIVTIASLIETEAKLSDERPLVGSVIYNRLKRDVPLGVDSSIIYASKLEGKWRNDGKVYKSDVERRSPYNTRLHAGLPPGPIAAPGKSSLEAALFPASTDYLYYVREPSRNDGAHNFYSNEHDFGVGVQALRNWEAERDAAAGK